MKREIGLLSVSAVLSIAVLVGGAAPAMAGVLCAKKNNRGLVLRNVDCKTNKGEIRVILADRVDDVGDLAKLEIVGTAAIEDEAVTTQKLDDDAVTTEKILDGTIGTKDLAEPAVQAQNVANDAIDGMHIVDGSITEADLAIDHLVVNGSFADVSVGDSSTGAGVKSAVRHQFGLNDGFLATTAINLNASSQFRTSLFKAEFEEGADGFAFVVTDGDDASDGNLRAAITARGRAQFTDVVITGGGDLVEGFDAVGATPMPGSLLVADSTTPGKLKVSGTAYDTRVIGVVSGAGGVNPGIRMGQEGRIDGDTLVAMTGRVYVNTSTENGPIRPGDLLTTASSPGQAMKATDPERSFGSVVGKALTSLDDGSGLVLALVNLQ